MAKELTILYRGCLASCNYSCWYCPQAKKEATPDVQRADEDALKRFVDWVSARRDMRISVFFTPWGEALIHPWYQEAVSVLSGCDHVRRVAVQTNLSCDLEWLRRCVASRVGLWCTYHPGQVAREEFLAKCRILLDRGVPHSVGIVGLKEHIGEALEMRRLLPPQVYLWTNAYKDVPAYYTAQEVETFTGIDPLFTMNTVHHESKGKDCRCGSSVISVDHQGTIQRCHFDRRSLGNIYDEEFHSCLAEGSCAKETCGCHIGYVHMPHLKGKEIYGSGILERIPTERS